MCNIIVISIIVTSIIVTYGGSDTLQNPVRDFEITQKSIDFMISLKSLVISDFKYL